MRLIAYWLRTPRLGYGVTAYSLEDARELLSRYGFPRKDEEIVEVVEGIRHVDLDQDHVVPNAGPIVVRGVWYPRHNV